MKNLTPRYLDIPLLLLVIGAVHGVVAVITSQGKSSYLPIFDWSTNLWYIAFSLAATEAVVRNLFTRPAEHIHIDIKNHHLQFIVRHIMLGIILMSCEWAPDLNNFTKAFQYLTTRLGITLFLLGTLVMFVTHRKMKAL
jgi:hypothetical protein